MDTNRGPLACANRAVLIATDQVGKANSAVSMQRMSDYGTRKYRWRGAMDARERKAHVEIEEKNFDLDHPPDDRPPGYANRCRAGQSLYGTRQH